MGRLYSSDHPALSRLDRGGRRVAGNEFAERRRHLVDQPRQIDVLLVSCDDHLPFYGIEATAQTLPPAELGVPVLDRERTAGSQETRAAYLQRLADIAEGTWDFSIADPTAPSPG